MKRYKSPHRLVIFLVIGLIACQDDDALRPFFYGNYNLESITMDRIMDINNDGEASMDFFSQVEAGIDNQINRLTLFSAEMDEIQFALFFSNVLTVQSGVPIIRFPVENQSLVVVFDEDSGAFAVLRMQPLVPQAGQIIAINLIDRSTIDVEVNKSLYNFVTEEWIDTMVTYRFVRGLINP